MTSEPKLEESLSDFYPATQTATPIQGHYFIWVTRFPCILYIFITLKWRPASIQYRGLLSWHLGKYSARIFSPEIHVFKGLLENMPNQHCLMRNKNVSISKLDAMQMMAPTYYLGILSLISFNACHGNCQGTFKRNAIREAWSWGQTEV